MDKNNALAFIAHRPSFAFQQISSETRVMHYDYAGWPNMKVHLTLLKAV
jgi:hypothetical protein